ncbi:MAG TPA: hypothetical protein VM146_06155 [Steroidobacteraceae bacterium]|nr:hypothetical protein [Steroidobacteraceae bacterium]
MEPTQTSKPPRSYWVISILALAWMLLGVMAWTFDLMTDEKALAAMSEPQRQLYAARPGWLFGVYAVAIFSGLLGVIGLLIRKRWAITALALSLVAIIIQFGYTFLGMDAIGLLGPGEALPFPTIIFAIGAALLWFASRSRRSGYIG